MIAASRPVDAARTPALPEVETFYAYDGNGNVADVLDQTYETHLLEKE